MEIEDPHSKRKPQLSLEDRQEIVYLRRNGMTESEVSERLQIPKSTINSVFTKWKTHHTVENLKKPGRPKEITEEEEKMVIEAVEEDPTMSLSKIQGSILPSFSKPTIHRVLNGYGFESFTIPEKWALTPEHKKLRLEWALKYKDMPDFFWKSVIFTDESRIQNNPFKQKAWSSDKKALPLIEIDQWPIWVLCWGAISYEGKLVLECQNMNMTAPIYLALLKRRLLGNFPALSPQTKGGAQMDRLVFQQDGSSSHTAKQVKDYFKEKQIQVLPWPPKSPDLNLIEAVWSQLKSKLKRFYKDYEELVQDVKNSWNSLTITYIQNLYNSMNRRILAVIEAEGGPSRY